jgi:2-dehydro-3-deoxyphosphogluconate aldolase / (4S)-4-hydroxy-2-oxoglutarate aldolase
LLMAQYRRMEVLTAMLDIGLVPIFYNGDAETAKKIVKACVAGGARCLEFTNRGDLAWKVFVEIVEYSAQECPEAILGVGSIIDAPTAAMYLNSGANFVVAPGFNEEVARLCNRRKVAYSPGCGSVAEIIQAQEFGTEIVKVFPGGQVGGPAFLKAVKGPLPWTSLMPTGGVSPTPENVNEWIEAGAAVLGMGSKLIAKDLVAGGDWQAITDRVKSCLELIKEARRSG